MKPHPRIRKTIKWGGAVVTVLLVVVWVGSLWRTWIVENRNFACMLDEGSVSLYRLPPGEGIPHWQSRVRPPYQQSRRSSLLNWAPRAYRNASLGWTVYSLPLSGPVALTAAATVAAWCLDVRSTLQLRRRGNCAKCNYDRTGLASKGAKCPECGSLPL